VWWGSTVECISALARLERDGALNARSMMQALQLLLQLQTGMRPTQATKSGKRRHDLSASISCVSDDALRLAASWPQSGGRVDSKAE
jgi:hypothetical protein